MKNLIQIGKLFFTIGMIGFCFHQVIYADLRPVFLAKWPVEFLLQEEISIVVCLILIAGFLLMMFDKNAGTYALLIGCLFLILFLFSHLPFQLKNNPLFLGAWTDALKLLILSGGAFILSNSFVKNRNRLPKAVFKLNQLGKYLVGIPIFIFGIEHFIYIDFVATLVPSWVPGPVLWAYLAGIGLVLAGISITINVGAKFASLFLGAIIFIWFIILHIPRVIADPVSGNGNEVRSMFESLVFSGIAFLLAGVIAIKKENNP